ncbi:Fic family protein [Oribacterium sp.]
MGGTISQGEYLKKWESFYVNTIFKYCPSIYKPPYSYLLQTANSKDEIIKQLAKILDILNYFHPFREGNGRTQREVIRSLALSKGYSA